MLAGMISCPACIGDFPAILALEVEACWKTASSCRIETIDPPHGD
jgi:hypothetical protein